MKRILKAGKFLSAFFVAVMASGGSVIVFGILTISWFYFSWKIEKEEKEKKENEDKKKDSQRNKKK